MRKCSNCSFFQNGEPSHCRLKPPLFMDPKNVSFPFVRPDWWCGEFRLSLRNWLRNRKVKWNEEI